MSVVRSILVPGSLTTTLDDPRLKTYAIGTVGRAAAIFGVEEIVVYEDPQDRGGRQVTRVLEYQSTAPYLRKRLFPISEELEHVGILPPLNLSLHLAPSYVEEGQVRMGAMAGKRVDVGLDELAELDLDEGANPPDPGEQFPVEVTATQADRVLVRPCEPDEYTSFTVERAPDLPTALEDRSPLLGTSREGAALEPEDHLARGPCTLVFGTPDRGIRNVLGKEPGFPLVNTIPGQRTRSVRVEEALVASLAVLNDHATRL